MAESSRVKMRSNRIAICTRTVTMRTVNCVVTLSCLFIPVSYSYLTPVHCTHVEIVRYVGARVGLTLPRSQCRDIFINIGKINTLHKSDASLVSKPSNKTK